MQLILVPSHHAHLVHRSIDLHEDRKLPLVDVPLVKPSKLHTELLGLYVRTGLVFLTDYAQIV